MKETAYKVMVTSDYDLFKRLEGNRSVLETRVKKILNSISTVGYVMDPILVNEKFEVIDGQGRLEALRRLNMPVYFIQASGIGRRECIAMNMNQTNWTIADYIESYAEIGCEPYIFLSQLYKEYKGCFKLKVIVNALTGKVDLSKNIIQEGRFKCTKEEYDRAKEILSWTKKFVPIISRIGGHTEFYYMALNFCWFDKEIDNDRMYDKLSALQADLIPVAKIQQAFDQIEKPYNHRLGRNKKVYIKTNYQKHMDNKYGWYEKRYGDKYQ